VVLIDALAVPQWYCSLFEDRNCVSVFAGLVTLTIGGVGRITGKGLIMAPLIVFQDEHIGCLSLPWTCLNPSFSLTVHISTSKHLLPQLLGDPRGNICLYQDGHFHDG